MDIQTTAGRNNERGVGSLVTVTMIQVVQLLFNEQSEDIDKLEFNISTR